MTYQKGVNPTDLVTTHRNVFDAARNLPGTTAVYSTSPGGLLYSEDLGGPGYVWVTVWPNGWVQTLAIDDVRADLLAQMGAPKWKVYDYNRSNRAFRSRVAPAAPTGGVSFDFLPAPNSAVRDGDTGHDVPVLRGTGCLRRTNAFVRFYFETSTSGKFAETNYWWSNPVAIDLASLVAGDQTMTVPLTPDKWSDYYGHFGTAYPVEAAAAVKDVESMGLSFGGGCFFENGGGVSSGGGIFRLVTIAAMAAN